MKFLPAQRSHWAGAASSTRTRPSTCSSTTVSARERSTANSTAKDADSLEAGPTERRLGGVNGKAERGRLIKGVYDWNDVPLMALDHGDNVQPAAIPSRGRGRGAGLHARRDAPGAQATSGIERSLGGLCRSRARNLRAWFPPDAARGSAGRRKRALVADNYRCTPEVYDLARPLMEGHVELAEDLGQMQAPERHGPRPVLIVDENREDLLADVARRVSTAASERPAWHGKAPRALTSPGFRRASRPQSATP
jgi:hypothetical protein